MTNQELQQKYPAYSKSIFSDFGPDNPEVVDWQENVLNKVKGDSILPHYINKEGDFDIFWGWITHFFAIIVFFVRNFKKFFTDYRWFLDEVGEFMKQRDYIQDTRVKINEDLKISITEELYHKILANSRLINGQIVPTSGFDCTDFLPITEVNAIIVKVAGYNRNSEDISSFIKNGIHNINIAYYYADKSLGYADPATYNLTSTQARVGRRFTMKFREGKYEERDIKNNYQNYIDITYKIDNPEFKEVITDSENRIIYGIRWDGTEYKPNVVLIVDNPYHYIRISYPRLGNSSLPLYLSVFFEGEGALFKTHKSEKEIFDVFSDFRKRGTFKGASLIKKVLEAKQEDNFYADYLPQRNTGWFLNRNSPTYQELIEKIKIDAFIPSAFAPIGFTFLLDSEGYYLLDSEGYYLLDSDSSEIQITGQKGGGIVTIPYDLPFPTPPEEEDRINSWICMKEQYFLVNQNTSLVMKWTGDVYTKSPYDSLSDSEGYDLLDSKGDILVTPEMVTPTRVSDVGDSEIILYLSIYDKDKNLLSDVPLLKDFEYDESKKSVVSRGPKSGDYQVITIKPKYSFEEEKYFVELPIEIIDSENKATFQEETYDKDWFILNNKLYLFTKKNNEGTHEAYYIRVHYIQMIYADVRTTNGYNGYDGYLENFELGLYLKSLPVTMGFLNIKQYYLCCFKNNSGYTDAKAKEIIDQKIIPYNGYRLFLDNSYYKNKITVPLELEYIKEETNKNNYQNYIDITYKISNSEFKEVILDSEDRILYGLRWDGSEYRPDLTGYYIGNISVQEIVNSLSHSREFRIKIKGGIPPYNYKIGENIISSYFQEYSFSISNRTNNKINILITDTLGSKIIESLFYSSFNGLNYKFKLFIDINSNLNSYIFVSGGSESSYNIERIDINNNSVIIGKTIPANTWIDITNILPAISNNILNDKYIRIKDNFSNILIDIPKEEFMKFGLDIYDNGEGELIN